MENGVHDEVEGVKLRAEDFDGDVVNGGDDAGEGGSHENGDDDEDAVETQAVMEKAVVDPVEEVASLKVNGGESTSGSTTMDQPAVIENNKSNEPMEFEEPEGKLLNFVEVNEERNTSDSAASNQPSGSEAKEAMDDGFSEAKVQAIDGESTSDTGARDETNELEIDELAGEKDEAKRVGVSEVSGDESDMLENNGVGKVSNVDILEGVHEVNKMPVAVVLENSENGVSDNVHLDETGIDKYGVNGDSVSCKMQPDSEIGVEENVGVNEKDTSVTKSKDDDGVIHEDGVNGDSVSCKIQPDGEIGAEANGDVKEKDMLVTVSKDDVSIKRKEKFETLLDVQNGSTDEHIQEGEPKSFDPLSGHQDCKKAKEGGTSGVDKPDNHVKITVIPEVGKGEPDNNETKHDMQEKKEPELRPVVIQEGEPKSFDPLSGHQDDKKVKEGSTSAAIGEPDNHVEETVIPEAVKSEPSSAIGEPDNRVEETVIPEAVKSEPETNEVKQDMPEKKGPESRPVIIQEGEPKSFDPLSGHEDDNKVNGGSTSAIGEPDNRVERKVIPEAEKSEPENSKVKQDIPEKKEPESRSVIIQEREPKTFDPLSGHQDDKKVKVGSTSGVDKPDNHVGRTVIPEAEKSEQKNHEVKQDTPVKKQPESRPVIGVSLSTHKSAAPKHESKPNQSPIPNSKPAPAPSATPTRPAGLGSGAPLLEPAHRVVRPQPNGNGSLQNQVLEEPTNGEADETDDTREKLQMIRVKFLRLARRLGQTPHNVVVAQVLYRLGLAEQLRGSNGGRAGAFSFERASAMAEQLEAVGQDPLEFSCTIMVLGKTGVGKSATINSIFDEVKFGTNAFELGTKKVQDVVGTVQGIKVRVIDTPGLLSSWADQRKNVKILQSVKRFIQKSPPDIVLYLDRLDMQSRDSGDMPLLRTITDIFGQSIWFNAIVVLTHAASAPPEGPNGAATTYDLFVTQRSHVVQQAIRQAAGDMRLMNPVSLVENHSACRTNPAGQRVLPNGQVWKPHLLLLSFASKILVEANMLLKLQDSPPGKPFAARSRAPPLPFILSNLLQSRPQLKLPQEQFGDEDDDVGDDVTDESSDEETSEYDELPPFKRLTNAQLSKLSKAQKKSYYDELEYREKLFMKKQLKEEKKRRKMMKKMAEAVKNNPTDVTDNNNAEEDSNSAATVPVAFQDMTLPASFDADNPTHRYRALDSANQWLTRPVLDPHGWDHDVGYEGINVEHLLAVKDTIPVSFSGQITKDKKDANLQMEVSSAIKHGKSKSNSTTVAFDMQTIGKELSYALRSETRFINYRKNKASAGFSATYLGDSLTGGVKFEDKLMINKRGQLVVAGGAVMGRGDVAYGGSLEATLRDKDYPLGRFLTTIGLSVMDWHGDLALGWNAQSQIPIGRFTNLIGRVNLNNKGSGQVSVRMNSSEQLQIALVALVPLVSKLLGYYRDRDSAY